ncbi:MAG: LysM peptidoglycan-binding domain-containing protein [Actinomycetota bacterium]|nr:LysM peptidoglycan-binding domain-containing protein [Actinomycetota bacterium]HWM33710.1 LysM peptidoglycan-binding domain-containing protein [Pseudolysinimonas sp.]
MSGTREDSAPRDEDRIARAVFAGLAPSTASRETAAHREDERRRRVRQGVMSTMPIMLAGAMTVGMNLTGPLTPAEAAPKRPALPKSSATPKAPAAAQAPAAPKAPTVAVPRSYVVKAGDTVSGIAARYGLSTASVLALNGLGWKSLIFPGQTLKLTGAASTPAAPTSSTVGSRPATYTIKRGDTISGIASRYGLSTATLLTLNGLSRTSIIYPGQSIKLSGSSIAITPVSSVTPAPPADPPSTPPTSAPAPVIDNTYTIKSGDTVTSIAARFGVTVDAILAANGLSRSSIIYAGRTLTIPGVVSAQDGSKITPLTAEMATNARIIIQVGRSLGVSDRGLIIALAAAMQESSLRNITYGDRDSVGVFQQRPSTGWGTRSQLLDVAHASRLFFGGPSNPNKGKTRGLLDIAGWQSMTLTQAAQKVQISAYPNAYAKWEKSATAWLAQLG